MSLDFTIRRKEPVTTLHTGIWVRQNGQNVELSLEEAQERWPDQKIELYEEKSDVYWHGNITHNLGKMAEHVDTVHTDYTLYDLLWRPGEYNLSEVTRPYRYLISNALMYMLLHKKELEAYNPTNKWGDYNTLLSFVQNLATALADDEVLGMTIETSR